MMKSIIIIFSKLVIIVYSAADYHGEEALSYFIIREVQKIAICPQVVIFDGEVTTLIDHGQRFLLIGFVVNKKHGR